MLRLLLEIIFLFTCLESYSQSATLVWCKKCHDTTGKRLVRNLPIPDGATIIVEKKGSFKVLFGNHWTSVVDRPGKFSIDSIRTATVKIRNRQDSIYMQLVKRGLHDCNFKYSYKAVSNSVYGRVETDRIEVRDQQVFTRDSVYRIEWKHPIPYNGEYAILITDLFGEYVATYSTKETYLDVPLYKFKNITYKIISEECRESRPGYVHWGDEPKKK